MRKYFYIPLDFLKALPLIPMFGLTIALGFARIDRELNQLNNLIQRKK